ncbi:glucose-1-phosphate thymidylyltransferase [Pyrobaculum neutrophilum]|nr:glucose-1-phosphate thymidylyltransferase [Pyrobaculum neutrophilum]
MFGLVLAGGEGSRLRPFTFSTPKHLIPLLGRAMIEYPIVHLAEAGVSEVGVVVGYLGHLIQEHLGDGSRLGVRVRYFWQERRLGIAHAISLALPELKGPFVVYLGDNILAGGIKRHVRAFLEGDFDVYILLARVPDPSRFGVAVLRDGRVVKLVEKPREPISDLAVVGVYMFRDPEDVARAFSSLKPSWRGEYEVTDLIQWFIDRGRRVGFDFVDGWWKDVGTPEGLLEAVYLLLDHAGARVEGEVRGEVLGRVVVEKGAVVEGRVFGPAYVGPGAYVGRGAVVEHYVSLESGARLASGGASRSLLLSEAEVEVGGLRLVDSVLGRRSVVRSRRDLRGEARLIISDFSRVEL